MKKKLHTEVVHLPVPPQMLVVEFMKNRLSLREMTTQLMELEDHHLLLLHSTRITTGESMEAHLVTWVLPVSAKTLVLQLQVDLEESLQSFPT